MIRSMTGFGSAAFEVGGTAFQLELRSVNHRHLDLQVRLPRLMAGLEGELRRTLQARFGRGKLEISVSLRGAGAEQSVEVDEQAAARYAAAARALHERLGIAPDLGAAQLLALPGVSRYVEVELDEAALRAGLLEAADRAAEALLAMRQAEGRSLDRDLRGRLARIAEAVDDLESRTDTVQEAVRERLRKRLLQLEQETGLLDEARLHQEVVLAADRLDVTEELVRLRSHVEQFLGVLDRDDSAEPVGRRLEFLLQEMNRETNTVGSKAGDAPLAHRVVDLKTELERVREQVLNVE